MRIKFWLQIVDDCEGSPDIRTICRDPKGAVNEFNVQDVEIVIFENHSSGDITDFLLKTKLSQKKGYDDLTNILCFIDKLAVLPSVYEINKSLRDKKLNKESPVMLLGKVFQDQEKYRLVQIYPNISIDIIFDLDEVRKHMTYPGRLFLVNRGKKGKEPEFIDDGSAAHPFKKLGLCV